MLSQLVLLKYLRLWPLVNDRLNYPTPTIEPIGYGSGRGGQRRRHYGKPMTPLDRLLAAGVLSPARQAELLAYRDSPSPAAIGRARALRTALPTIAEFTVWGMRSGEKFLFDRGP